VNKSDGTTSFKEWYAELVSLARQRDALCLIGDSEDHRVGYDDDDTPLQELLLQLSYAD